MSAVQFYKEESFKVVEADGFKFEIPKDWEVVRLGNIVEIYDSKRIPLSEQERAKRKGSYPYCGATGIIDYIDDYIFDGEYVLLAEDGGYFGPFEQSAYIMSGKFWVNNHAHVLKAKDDIANNWYVMYVLNYIDLRPYIVGSTRTKLNQADMRRIIIPLPPLEEQKKIAHVLMSIDKAIEAVDESIKQAERVKKGLMQELLTKGIGHKEFKFSKELGCDIPKEWEVVRLGDVAKLESGGTPSRQKQEYWKNGTIPWVKSGELNDGIIYDTEEKITESGLKNSSAKIFPKGTLLIALYGATVGKTGILGMDASINQAVCAILPKTPDSLNLRFLQYCVIFLRKRLIAQSSGGAQPNIYLYVLKDFKIPLPPLEEQKKIAQILSKWDEVIEIKKAKKERLERMKKKVMELLLTGMVRIK